MKLSSERQIEEHAAASRRGAIEGTLASSSVALGASYYLQRRFATYRNLPLSIKALGIVLVTAPCFAIQAERRGLEYERSQWEGEALRVMDERALQVQRRWDALGWKERVSDWAGRHEYSIIMGGWAASLGVAGAIISRNRYQTTAQKVVQARMWAQGLTVGLLVIAGALTHSKRLESLEHRGNMDHSWKDILDQQERDRKHGLVPSRGAYVI